MFDAIVSLFTDIIVGVFALGISVGIPIAIIIYSIIYVINHEEEKGNVFILCIIVILCLSYLIHIGILLIRQIIHYNDAVDNDAVDNDAIDVIILADPVSVVKLKQFPVIKIQIDDDCSFCLEPLNSDEIIQLGCIHYFHKKCYEVIVSNGRVNCPLCRCEI
jgi:hypothetical protein